MSEEGNNPETRMAGPEDYEPILDAYFPVIDEARRIRAYYLGKIDGTPKIMPDHLEPLMLALAAAEKVCNVQQVEG